MNRSDLISSWIGLLGFLGELKDLVGLLCIIYKIQQVGIFAYFYIFAWISNVFKILEDYGRLF